MQYIDTHIHLTDFASDKQEYLIQKLRNKFYKIVCVSAKPDDWCKVAEISRKYPEFVIPAFCLHPWYIAQTSSDWYQKLEQYLKKFPNSWIGECGLDMLKAKDIDAQSEVFDIHIQLACKYNRVLNIHSLKADTQMFPLLDKISSKAVFHSYGSDVGFLRTITVKGFYASFSAASLQRKNFSELINNAPLDKILTESDAPYMSSSDDIPKLIKVISEIKNIDINELMSKINKNFKELDYAKQTF